MASNVSAGTRGLSAGDWVRLKRLKGSNNFLTDQPSDVTNPPVGTSCVFTNFGTSKIRRPASFWVNYREAKTTDYVLERQNAETKSRALTANKLCTCDTTSAVKEGNVYCS